MDTFEVLRRLTETPGPSGNEEAIAGVIAELWKPLVDEITVDRVGTLLALKRGGAESAEGRPRPRLLLAAHMDEIALMVRRIEEHQGYGFVRVTSVGGVDRRQLFGQTAVVHGRRDLIGVIGALPDQMAPDRPAGQAFSFEDIVVDVGLSIDQARELVSIGDFVSFRQPLRKLTGGRVAGKSLDNCASVAAVTVCLEQLRGRSRQWDLVAAATSQEETRLLGAYTSAFAQRPDVTVAIDVTFGKGPGVNDAEAYELGGGPVLGIGPNIHPGVFQALRDAAQSLEMTVGVEPFPYNSGTDAYALQIAREGIPTGLVQIPLRYMHTMVETVDTADVERAGRLLAELTTRLDDRFLGGLSEGLMRPESASADK